MTFYELEKICKKRRKRKIFFILFIIVFIALIIGAIFYFKQKQPKVIKKPTKTQIKTTPSKPLIETKPLPSYEECLKKAKMFYNQKQYQKAFKWAKNANSIDPTKEEAWIISAKALYKMNQKKAAIEILKLYLKYYHSDEVNKTLQQIRGNQ